MKKFLCPAIKDADTRNICEDCQKQNECKEVKDESKRPD
jgi:hypothetical protein